MADPVLVLHSTEGTTIRGAVAAMDQAGSQCHEVVDPYSDAPGWDTEQLRDWLQPARSLRHPPTTPETNNRGYTSATAHLGKVYQVEIVGHAARMSHTTDDPYPRVWWENLAQYLTGLCQDLGVPVRFPHEFLGVNQAYGTTSRSRMLWSEWAAVSGIVGHQHVPGNSHWDPGSLGPALIPLMTGEPPPMPTPDEVTLPGSRDATIRRIQTAAGVTVDGDPYTATAAAVEALRDLAEDRGEQIQALEQKVSTLELRAPSQEDSDDAVLGAFTRAALRQFIQQEGLGQ